MVIYRTLKVAVYCLSPLIVIYLPLRTMVLTIISDGRSRSTRRTEELVTLALTVFCIVLCICEFKLPSGAGAG